MSRQTAGLRRENQVINDLSRHTDDSIRVYPQGFSGNDVASFADIVVTTGVGCHNIEFKTHSADRESNRIADCRSYVADQDDIGQLCNARNDYTKAHLAVAFDHCELLVQEILFADPELALESLVEVIPECFQPHATDSGKLRLRKPKDTDVWPSKTAGLGDAAKIAKHLGIPYDHD